MLKLLKKLFGVEECACKCQKTSAKKGTKNSKNSKATKNAKPTKKVVKK